MADNTGKALRTKMIYSVFIRNYSKEGTFEALRQDLDRIRALGTDIIWLMPVHPVGEKHRKGTLGSPYAIRDYRAVNPEFGSMEDFVNLTNDIHEKGMKVIIDVVYNHTSPDSVLAKEHPEWFFHKKDGSFGNKTGDWWDVIDLDYNNRALWDYQIETLKIWARYVDGFRCDVAPMIPIEFWMQARQEIEEVRPGCIWLAESVEPEFIRDNRRRGITCASDSEIFRAFDISYEYDVYWDFNRYLTGEEPLASYAQALNRQEAMYPDNYDKLRFLENHDRLRARFLIPQEQALRNWLAFVFFQKGTTLIYAGQEAGAARTPSLFDKDPVDWDGTLGVNTRPLDLSQEIARLHEIVQDPVFANSSYHVSAMQENVLGAIHVQNSEPSAEVSGTGAAATGTAAAAGTAAFAGIFPLGSRPCVIRLARLTEGAAGSPVIPDGSYTNLIDGSRVEVSMGEMTVTEKPVIFKFDSAVPAGDRG